jgi:hypothetical protein
MIYINGKLVDLTDKTETNPFHEVVKDYEQFIADLRARHGNTVLLYTPSSRLRLDPISKAPLPPKGYAWPYETTIVHKDGPQKWVYAKEAALVKDGRVEISDAHFHISDSKSISLDEDPDLIFFLSKTRAFRRGKLWIFDPRDEEDKIAQAHMEDTKLQDTIYSEYSPLFNDTTKLEEVALKWGVKKTPTSTVNGIRNALFNAVRTGEDAKRKHRKDARGIAEFLSDVKDIGSLKIAGNIQTAIDMGTLVLNRQTGEWQLTIANGEMPIVLMTAGHVGGDVARQKLLDYLEKNKPDAELLEQVISGEAKVEYGKVVTKEPEEKIILPGDVTLDNIDQEEDGKNVVTFRMLQKTAKALQVNSFGKSEPELRAVVRERLEQLAHTV